MWVACPGCETDPDGLNDLPRLQSSTTSHAFQSALALGSRQTIVEVIELGAEGQSVVTFRPVGPRCGLMDRDFGSLMGIGRGGVTEIRHRRELVPHRSATQPTHHDGAAAPLGHSPRILNKWLERESFATQLIYGPKMTRCRVVRQVNDETVGR